VSFELQWTKAPIKDLEHLPDRIIAQVIKAVDELANDPRPRSSKKLIGTAKPTEFVSGLTESSTRFTKRPSSSSLFAYDIAKMFMDLN